MEAHSQRNLLRSIPSVNELLNHPALQEVLEQFPRQLVVSTMREEIARLREEIRTQSFPPAVGAPGELAARIAAQVAENARFALRKLVNATGIVIHTNLGRAPLSATVLDNVRAVAEGYSNLEYDLYRGERGSRYQHVEKIITDLTGAESALVVNNNAAAVLVALNALARNREVIVSRGELIEIGGSFRLPDVMRQSGCVLKEVGATNRTRIEDYEEAITPETGLLLKAHTSNYRIMGFSESVSLAELVGLGKKYDISVMEDLGSGTFVDLSYYGLPEEPTVNHTVAAGADIITFSGDKLLGGPQAGVIVGSKEQLAVIKKNPLLRAVRVDKFTISALEATLREYLDTNQAMQNIPVLQMLSCPKEKVRKKADRLCRRLKKNRKDKYHIKVEPDFSQAGGGSLPQAQIPTFVVAVVPSEFSVAELDRRLRENTPPVIGRVSKERMLFDLRTVFDNEIPIIADALERLS
jgi:L-seryl-tRNA(Ser) seleniumtransferase